MTGTEKDKDRRKGKGRRFCLGEECIQFLAALAVLPRTILNKRMNFNFLRRLSAPTDKKNFPGSATL